MPIGTIHAAFVEWSHGWASGPTSRSRFIHTCCAMPAAINAPTMAATPAQSSTISGTEISNTRLPTPRWRRIVLVGIHQTNLLTRICTGPASRVDIAVVDNSKAFDMNGHGGDSITSSLVGSPNWNTAPLGTLGKARSCPPCDSMIVRLTANPIPMPSGFVV
jgi:hypothetical protein